ncbi:transporter substrate-binding domain-containing protein [Mesorhizobium sp. LHD-90]|uniref:transporter substrate-binding domain-containing protein n=1 Tax=Mesorhizobium sp. LHD-90 TaxID=3071414 RepID=UPI0027DFB6D2|nr:transporter substrate-binding domain-containing protein [Mesorhizobium sp. LHD-90]MDQ6435635.1 transporter substrate-binding domain-containing protein [Mesorhizobium sp. LHD-90]
MLKHLSRIVLAAFVASAVSVIPAGAADLQEIVSAGKVRIGVPVDVPPFGSVDASNQPVGLDVDMANNIAKALGVTLEMQQITGANRVPYLATDRLDIVIAAMGATPERALQIAFTSPYAALSIGVFGPDSIAVSSPSELTDQTIAVARGTTQDLELTKAAPNAKILRFDDDATAAAAFTSGQAQLLATADVVAKDMMDKDPKIQLKPKFILQFSPCYIGIQQGSPELLRWLDTYIHLGVLDGSLSALSAKWIGTPLPPNFPNI